jgi:hypothetical protein
METSTLFSSDAMEAIKERSEKLHAALSPLINMIASCHVRHEFIYSSYETLGGKEIEVREEELKRTINFCMGQMIEVLQIK